MQRVQRLILIMIPLVLILTYFQWIYLEDYCKDRSNGYDGHLFLEYWDNRDIGLYIRCRYGENHRTSYYYLHRVVTFDTYQRVNETDITKLLEQSDL